MRRADRLFQIVQALRRDRATTAARLAERFEVSERTIYRDVADLVASGVPIEGEAGVGYQLADGMDLPPLMFDKDEIEALVLGVRMVQSRGDGELRRAARSVLDKVEAVLPPRDRPRVHSTALFALRGWAPERPTRFLTELRHSIEERRRVVLTYGDRHGERTERTVRPLALFTWSSVWTLAAWCELRGDHRNFRLDRIEDARVLEETFELVPPVTLEDFERSVMGG